jgi:hypothetical protein
LVTQTQHGTFFSSEHAEKETITAFTMALSYFWGIAVMVIIVAGLWVISSTTDPPKETEGSSATDDVDVPGHKAQAEGSPPSTETQTRGGYRLSFL